MVKMAMIRTIYLANITAFCINSCIFFWWHFFLHFFSYNIINLHNRRTSLVLNVEKIVLILLIHFVDSSFLFSVVLFRTKFRYFYKYAWYQHKQTNKCYRWSSNDQCESTNSKHFSYRWCRHGKSIIVITSSY